MYLVDAEPTLCSFEVVRAKRHMTTSGTSRDIMPGSPVYWRKAKENLSRQDEAIPIRVDEETANLLLKYRLLP